MNWAVELSHAAERDFWRFPRDVRDRLERAIDELEADPFRGHVQPLRGPQWKGRHRKRVGAYRIIFTADHREKTVAISAILVRSERTYRQLSWPGGPRPPKRG